MSSPEYPPPAQQVNYAAAIKGPEHRPSLSRRPYKPHGQTSSGGGHDTGSNCHADGHRSPSADGLDDPSRYHLGKAGRQGHKEGSYGEEQQGNLVYPWISVNISDTAHQRHGHRVAQQVACNDPRGLVYLSYGDLDVQHDAGQGCHHHRLVQGGGKNPQAHDGQYQWGR